MFVTEGILLCDAAVCKKYSESISIIFQFKTKMLMKYFVLEKEEKNLSVPLEPFKFMFTKLFVVSHVHK